MFDLERDMVMLMMVVQVCVFQCGSGVENKRVRGLVESVL